MSKKRKYTERQRKFARLYVQLGNASESARQAGYSPEYADARAHQLVGKCRELIEQERERARALDILRLEEIQRELRELIVGTTDRAGNPIPPSTRVRAIEVAAKMLGAFVEKRQVEMSGGLTLESLLDEALAKAQAA